MKINNQEDENERQGVIDSENGVQTYNRGRHSHICFVKNQKTKISVSFSICVYIQCYTDKCLNQMFLGLNPKSVFRP